jgi:ubiquinone/menaquinone biosynthesis C-methylase UbiE
MILNVGCGGRPLDFDKSFGDVRLDIERFPSVTIIADAQNLPFKDKTFELVYASHLLEHLENPFKVIKEFKRVSKNMVVVKVPNAVYYKTTY